MKSKIDGYKKICDGVPVYQDPTFKDKLSAFYEANEGRMIIEKHEVVRDVKSYEQLKFYFGVVVPAMCEATGVKSRVEMDEQLRYEFLSEEKENAINGGLYYAIPSLSIDANKVDKIKMAKYINDCLDLLVECGGSIAQNDIDRFETAMRAGD